MVRFMIVLSDFISTGKKTGVFGGFLRHISCIFTVLIPQNGSKYLAI